MKAVSTWVEEERASNESPVGVDGPLKPLKVSDWRRSSTGYEQQQGRGRLKRLHGKPRGRINEGAKTRAYALFVDGKYRGTWHRLDLAKIKAYEMTISSEDPPEAPVIQGRAVVPVIALEFHEGGNTIWIHGPQGGTTLRIKTMGKVTTSRCNTSPISHGDIVVQEDIHICLGKDES